MATFEPSSRGNSDYVAMSEQELVHRRDQEFARQEIVLHEIQIGAQGLTQAARAINVEVVDSTKLVGDIDRRVDRVQVDLEVGEARARAVNAQKSKVCKLYALIALLVLAELVLKWCDVPFFDFTKVAKDSS